LITENNETLDESLPPATTAVVSVEPAGSYVTKVRGHDRGGLPPEGGGERIIIYYPKVQAEPEQVLHLLPHGSICGDGAQKAAYPEGQRTHGRFTTFAASTRNARNAAGA